MSEIKKYQASSSCLCPETAPAVPDPGSHGLFHCSANARDTTRPRAIMASWILSSDASHCFFSEWHVLEHLLQFTIGQAGLYGLFCRLRLFDKSWSTGWNAANLSSQGSITPVIPKSFMPRSSDLAS